MTPPPTRPGDADRLRRFTDFFKALGHPLRIWILEILSGGPRWVGELQEATGSAGSSISQQLAVLRGQGIVVAERRGTMIIYAAADAAIFELLDVARRLRNSLLSSTVDLLRLVEGEAEGPRAGT